MIIQYSYNIYPTTAAMQCSTVLNHVLLTNVVLYLSELLGDPPFDFNIVENLPFRGYHTRSRSADDTGFCQEQGRVLIDPTILRYDDARGQDLFPDIGSGLVEFDGISLLGKIPHRIDDLALEFHVGPFPEHDDALDASLLFLLRLLLLGGDGSDALVVLLFVVVFVVFAGHPHGVLEPLVGGVGFQAGISLGAIHQQDGLVFVVVVVVGWIRFHIGTVVCCVFVVVVVLGFVLCGAVPTVAAIVVVVVFDLRCTTELPQEVEKAGRLEVPREAVFRRVVQDYPPDLPVGTGGGPGAFRVYLENPVETGGHQQFFVFFHLLCADVAAA
mmetsp:Transcript_5104/g.10719  ORF Transcript_5104/g.10719 Transcript_5104/m.10719 type:complete len:328 (-) Transcript_5104:20-1003(-)